MGTLWYINFTHKINHHTIYILMSPQFISQIWYSLVLSTLLKDICTFFLCISSLRCLRDIWNLAYSKLSLQNWILTPSIPSSIFPNPIDRCFILLLLPVKSYSHLVFLSFTFQILLPMILGYFQNNFLSPLLLSLAQLQSFLDWIIVNALKWISLLPPFALSVLNMTALKIFLFFF